MTGLARLAEARKAALETLHHDMPVPRITPPVVVRVRPITGPEIKAVTKRFAKDNSDESVAKHNAALLVEACIGVFGVDEHGDPVEDPSEWPRFDPTLATILDLPDASTAVDVVLGLYLTDLDVAAAAMELLQWSGQAPGASGN